MRIAVPFEALFRGYQRPWLTADLLAGLTVWAILVPEALAYGAIAGVPPIYGLYAAPFALVLYAALGSSRHLVVGPISSMAALSAVAVGGVAAAGSDEFIQLTIALTLVVGAVALVAGVLRLGFIANFISEPVLKGFIIGLSLTIIVGQLPKLFGIEGSDGNFFQKSWDLLKGLDETSGYTVAIGAASLGLILGLKRVDPRIPGSLIAVFLGIGAVTLFNLDEHGVSIVGDIERGLPPFGLPDDVSHSQYTSLIPAALGMMLVGFAEGLGAARTYAAKEHYDIDPNRELVATGAANLGAGLFSGIAVSGSLSKTAVNGGAGAKTQLSGLFAALLTVLALLLLTGLFEHLPEATLGAVVIAAVIGLVDFKRLGAYYRASSGRIQSTYGLASRTDFIAAVATVAGVLAFDILPGLAIGLAVSVALLVYRSSRPHISVLGRVPGTAQYTDVVGHPENEELDGIVILRIDGGLYFANAEHVRIGIRAHAAEGVRAVIVDATVVSAIDITAMEMLAQLVVDLEARGVQLMFTRGIQLLDEEFKAGGETTILSRLYADIPAAIAAAGETRA